MPAKDFKSEPANRKPHDEHAFLNQTSIEIEEWLNKIVNKNFAEDEDRINFASFFSARMQKKMPKFFLTLMPLLDESINSSAMVRHCVNLTSKLTNPLNPGQVTIITADQPVFAIGKQVECRYPGKFKDMVWMLGPLHIEIAFMNKMDFSTTERIESFLSGKKVKRTRYAHQVTLAALKKLTDVAFQDQTEFADFESWRKSIKDKNANNCFWFLFAFILSSGDSQGTNTKIDDLMKKLFFSSNSPCFTHLFLFFTGKTNIQNF